MPPKARICYICGRPTLLPGFDNHVVQCRELFEKREMQKPPKERRPCPADPCLNTRGDLNAMNEASQRAWEGTLLPCQNCGRKFLPEKLSIHNRSCTAANPAKRVNASSSAYGAPAAYDDYGPPSGQSTRPMSAGSSRKIHGGSYALPSNNNGYNSNNDFANDFPTYGHLIKCKDCGRNFNENSFAKHAKVCRKVFQQKRKPFDSAKHRAEGTELAQYLQSTRRRGGGGASSSMSRSTTMTSAPPQRSAAAAPLRKKKGLPKWKAESLSFREAIRQARLVSMAEKKSKDTGIPLHALLPSNAGFSSGPSAIESTYIRCPHCGRSFNEKAAERHIPKCQSIINKPSRLVKGSGTAVKSLQSSPPSKTQASSYNSGYDRPSMSSSNQYMSSGGMPVRRGSFSQQPVYGSRASANDMAESFASMSMSGARRGMDEPVRPMRTVAAPAPSSSSSSSSYGRGAPSSSMMASTTATRRPSGELARPSPRPNYGANEPVRATNTSQRMSSGYGVNEPVRATNTSQRMSSGYGANEPVRANNSQRLNSGYGVNEPVRAGNTSQRMSVGNPMMTTAQPTNRTRQVASSSSNLGYSSTGNGRSTTPSGRRYY